ncbi:MAG TPA: hypothetical protein EYQ80_06770, partial [Candidatus Poseidoniales archaeon]|nr:hypothetical protein [Candidatus Poseidoniales archaeon]
MANHPDRFAIWPGYFDSKTSRRSGRRVAKEIAIRNPNLDGLAYAARGAGIKKMKREESISHPSRPHLNEGRLWIAIEPAKAATTMNVACRLIEGLAQLRDGIVSVGGAPRRLRDVDEEVEAVSGDRHDGAPLAVAHVGRPL